MFKNLFGHPKRRSSLPKHVRMPSLPSLLEEGKTEVLVAATPPEDHKQLSFFRQRRKSEPTTIDMCCSTAPVSFLPPSLSYPEEGKKPEVDAKKKAQTDESAVKNISSQHPHKHSRRKSEPLLIKVMPLMKIKENIEDISITDITKLEILAKSGCQEARVRLGYSSLRDDIPDKIKAKYWFELAIQQAPETPAAYWAQGLMYLEGFSGLIGLNYKKQAFECFVKAADKGHAGASYSLGICYWQGIGMVKDREEAFKMFQVAADKNWAEAQFMVGMHYFVQLPPAIGFLDEETNSILTRATCYFRLAALQGNKDAIDKLKVIQQMRDQLAGKKNLEEKAAFEQEAHFCRIL